MIINFLTLRIHNLLPITVAYMVGICCCYKILGCYLIGISLLLVLAMLSITLYSKQPLSKYGTLGLLCIIAFSAGNIAMSRQRSAQESLISQLQDKPCDAIAQVVSIDPIDHTLYHQCIIVALTHITYKDDIWVPTQATIAIYTKRNHCTRNLWVGDIIGINDLTIKKINNGSFGDYLLKEGISATLFIPMFDATPITRPLTSWHRWIFNLKSTTLARIKRKMSPKTFQLFASIFLGNKNSPKKLIEKTKDHFTTWGVTHYLARSGLHMVIFVFIWQLVLNFLPLPWIIKELILLTLGIIYCLLSWSSVSFNRAFFTFLLYKTCTLLRVQTNFLHLLTLVCLLILIHNPIQLFFLDFQLSFGLTFALACFTQIQLHHKHQRYQTIAS